MKRTTRRRRVQHLVQQTARDRVGEPAADAAPINGSAGPFSTSEADGPPTRRCRKCGLENEAGAERCANPRCQGALAGNTFAVTKGLYVRDRSRLPQTMQDALGDLDGFRTALESDQGGADAMTIIQAGYVRRLVEVEALCRLLGADLRAHGIFTAKRRVRNTFGAFLTAVEKWDRLAQRLGMGRRQRDVGQMSAAEYLAAQQDER